MGHKGQVKKSVVVLNSSALTFLERRKGIIKKKAWTEAEKAAVQKHLKHFMDKRKVPGKEKRTV